MIAGKSKLRKLCGEITAQIEQPTATHTRHHSLPADRPPSLLGIPCLFRSILSCFVLFVVVLLCSLFVFPFAFFLSSPMADPLRPIRDLFGQYDDEFLRAVYVQSNQDVQRTIENLIEFGQQQAQMDISSNSKVAEADDRSKYLPFAFVRP